MALSNRVTYIKINEDNMTLMKINYAFDHKYVDFANLPEDINLMINSFLSSNMEVKFKLNKLPKNKNTIEYYNIKYDLNMITQINLQNLIELFQWTMTEMEYEDIIYVLTTDLMHIRINNDYTNKEQITI